jgi:hypothetical protein
MALLYIDSFDHYLTADILKKWTHVGTGVTIGPTAGRHSSAGVAFPSNSSAYVRRPLAPVDNTTVIMGFSYHRTTAPSNSGFAEVMTQGGTNQLMLCLGDSGVMYLSRGGSGGNALYPGGTIVASGTVPLTTGAVYYIEWKVFLHDVAGTTEVRINGIADPGLTWVGDTMNSTTPGWGAVQFGNWSAFQWNMDDLYILDGSGGAPWNNFLGDCRVDARLPTGPGAQAQWTPLTGANWQNVDEPTPNDDTDYCSAATVGLTDSHAFQDAPVVGAAIYGVQHCLNLKKTDAGGCLVQPIIRAGVTNYPGASISPSTVYGYGFQMAQLNPATGVAWTEAAFNAAEFGYTRVG